MKNTIALGLGFLSFSLMAEINKPWDGISDPLIMGKNFKRNFEELPLSGRIRVKNKLWSGDYWPLYKGNINYRWFSSVKNGFNLHSPSKEEAAKMTIPELAALSPAEKFDLFTGRYDYPLKTQVNSISSPNAQKWEGICHGWAPAAMNHEEPMPKLMTNPQGIEIPFGSTDIKALLSYYYAYGFETYTAQMGQRCYPETGNGCQDDLNAGAFHIVLANKVGLEGISFIADIEAFGEVWNNPAHHYVSTVIREFTPVANSAPGTVKVVRMRTEFFFADNGENQWRPVIGTPLQVIKSRNYEYDLDLDAYGNIIGGDWKSRSRPDFLWTKPRPIKFTGLMFRLGELIED